MNKAKFDSGEIVPQPCGCQNYIGGEIKFCPMHQTAPELLAALEDLLAFVKRGTYDPKQVPNAEAAIQKARGE